MKARIVTRWFVPIALGALAGAVLGPIGPPLGPARAQEARKGLSEGEKAILALDEAFVRGFNAGDSKALAAQFAEDAEVVDPDGTRIVGRDAIAGRFAEGFAARPGRKLAIETDSIRFLTPDVAQEEGRSLARPPQGAPVEATFTALYVRRDGTWRIASLRETEIESARPHDRLEELAWMIGEWVEERPDASVRFLCRWSEDGNFLLRTATVRRAGRPVLSISQRIGWDPQAKQIRSWEFDASGGFGEGRWVRDGERWVVKHTDVQADGTATSATNVMTRERPDQIRWVSTDRVVGDEAVPDDEANILVRVPPPAGPPPSPDAPRRPR